MILRLADSLSRGLVVLVSLLVALGLSFFAVRTAVASFAAEKETKQGLERAVQLEPRNPDYWFRLGHYQQFNLEQPDFAGSVESYQKAVKLNPGYTEAWLDLGTAY